MQNNKKPSFTDVSQLCVGLYVHLDLGWMDHPFPTSNFKIKDAEQIANIQKIGMKRIRYAPERSDCEPLSPVEEKPIVESTTHRPDISIASDKLVETKASTIEATQEKRVERLHQMHQAMEVCEKKFIDAGNTTKQVLKDLLLQPKQSIAQAEHMMNDMVNSALGESEMAINAINGARSDDTNYVHSLNVTVLALMMARSLNMSEEESRQLGMACLFHDIGKSELSDKITLKKEPLTTSEQLYYEQHSELGARIAKEAGMPNAVVNIIMQHHEYADGTGYPKRLKAEQTHPLARLLAIINAYDNLCNPQNIALAKTPYEALAHMFANQRSKFDDVLLNHLIKSLGVYPPGSIVQLSNGLYGVVVAANPPTPLRPVVMLYDAHHVNKHKPLIVSLREDKSLNINLCVRPNQLPKDALNYLNPRKRISYFFDADLVPENLSA